MSFFSAPLFNVGWLKTDKMNKLDQYKVPRDIEYMKFSSLSMEARLKLSKVKPINLGQANRISGVSPADISVLMVYLNK